MTHTLALHCDLFVSQHFLVTQARSQRLTITGCRTRYLLRSTMSVFVKALLILSLILSKWWCVSVVQLNHSRTTIGRRACTQTFSIDITVQFAETLLAKHDGNQPQSAIRYFPLDKYHVLTQRLVMPPPSSHSSLHLQVLAKRFFVAKFQPGVHLPPCISRIIIDPDATPPGSGFFSVTRTKEETSLVGESHECMPNSLEQYSGWRCIKIKGPMEHGNLQCFSKAQIVGDHIWQQTSLV